MTKYEKIVVSAYTGVLMCDFADLHKYIQEKLDRPVWAHELASKAVWAEIEKATQPEFLALAEHETTPMPENLVAEIAAEIETLRADAKATWDAGEVDRYEARADTLEWVLGRLTGDDVLRSWAHY